MAKLLVLRNVAVFFTVVRVLTRGLLADKLWILLAVGITLRFATLVASSCRVAVHATLRRLAMSAARARLMVSSTTAVFLRLFHLHF